MQNQDFANFTPRWPTSEMVYGVSVITFFAHLVMIYSDPEFDDCRSKFFFLLFLSPNAFLDVCFRQRAIIWKCKIWKLPEIREARFLILLRAPLPPFTLHRGPNVTVLYTAMLEKIAASQQLTFIPCVNNFLGNFLRSANRKFEANLKGGGAGAPHCELSCVTAL